MSVECWKCGAELSSDLSPHPCTVSIENFKAKLEAFTAAALELDEAWGNFGLEANTLIEATYPDHFGASFDELVLQITAWRDAVRAGGSR